MSKTWVVVYAGDLADATVLKDFLVGQGVTAQLADQVMGTLAPWLVGMGALRAVKVLVPEDEVDQAEPIVTEFTEPAAADGPAQPAPAWTCARCGEANEDQFDVCWKCGTPHLGAE
jgi:hypothetical protein